METKREETKRKIANFNKALEREAIIGIDGLTVTNISNDSIAEIASLVEENIYSTLESQDWHFMQCPKDYRIPQDIVDAVDQNYKDGDSVQEIACNKRFLQSKQLWESIKKELYAGEFAECCEAECC